jgi:hypothetical protein
MEQLQHIALRSLPAQQSLHDLRFRKLLRPQDWETLAPAIRTRFSKRLGPGASIVYRGEIVETRMSRFGRMFVTALRIIGAPLPLDCNNAGAATVVTVTEAAGSKGQIWTRQYNRRNGFPQVIHSSKGFRGPTGLEEAVGHGIGMSLKLKTKPDQLLFISNQFFVTLLGRRIALPKPLCPGRLVVGHRELGGGCFEYTLDLRHPYLGELLFQRATFHDMTEAEHD